MWIVLFWDILKYKNYQATTQQPVIYINVYKDRYSCWNTRRFVAFLSVLHLFSPTSYRCQLYHNNYVVMLCCRLIFDILDATKGYFRSTWPQTLTLILKLLLILYSIDRILQYKQKKEKTLQTHLLISWIIVYICMFILKVNKSIFLTMLLYVLVHHVLGYNFKWQPTLHLQVKLWFLCYTRSFHSMQ